MLKENMQVLKDLNIDEWNEKGYTGKDVKVAILDVDCKPYSHMNGYLFDIIGSKVSGHGTDIGFTIHELVSDVEVYAFNRNDSKAYDWIKDHKNEIDLINISMAGLNGSKTSTYERFKDLNIPVICASGNDGFDDKISYPANYDWTIGIGGSGKNGNGEFKVDRDSNGGADLDAVAPYGMRILGENNKSWTSFGTSISSAVVTGMLACYIQWRKENGLPKLQPEEARKFIRDNALDIEEKGFDYESGYGVFRMPSVPEPPKKEPETYTVRQGNSVSGLAKKYKVSQSDILKWNNLGPNVHKLKAGSKIYLKDPKH